MVETILVFLAFLTFWTLAILGQDEVTDREARAFLRGDLVRGTGTGRLYGHLKRTGTSLRGPR